MAAQDGVSARRGMRAFMAGEDGYVLLAPGPDAVEIDSLYVVADARGHGVGASLVAAALAAGGQEVAWIVADDEGRARPLYERLGFVTVRRFYDFVRTPALRER